MNKLKLRLLAALVAATMSFSQPVFSEAAMPLLTSGEPLNVQCEGDIVAVQNGDVWTVSAKNNVLLERSGTVFLGDELFFDYKTQTGYLINPRIAQAPWYLSGSRLEFAANGSYEIFDCAVTTCAHVDKHWGLTASKVHISNNNIMTAHNLVSRYGKIPFFWLPYLSWDISTKPLSGARYGANFGGVRGTVLSYEQRLYQRYGVSIFALLDWHMKYGPGLGLSASYVAPNGAPTRFVTSNYLAWDRSIESTKAKLRYRISGMGSHGFADKRTTFYGIFDRVSDAQVITDYTQTQFNRVYTHDTSFLIQHKRDFWLASLLTRLRMNDFESINEELPSVSFSHRPIELYKRIQFVSRHSLGFLRFNFPRGAGALTDYDSMRATSTAELFRSFHFIPYVQFTPRVVGKAAYYGQGIGVDSLVQGLVRFELKAHSTWYRKKAGSNWSQSLEPYATWALQTQPLKPFSEQYLFDIEDSFVPLHSVQTGIRHNLYKNAKLWATSDIFAITSLSINNKRFNNRLMWTSRLTPTERSLLLLSACYNTSKEMLDSYNILFEKTVSRNTAFGIEYRHRNRYAYKTVDPLDFSFEAQNLESDLVASPLSDNRDTLLCRMHHRLNPDHAFMVESRHGWRRFTERPYDEGHVTWLFRLGCNWHGQFSVKKQLEAVGFVVGLSLADTAPRLASRPPASLTYKDLEYLEY